MSEISRDYDVAVEGEGSVISKLLDYIVLPTVKASPVLISEVMTFLSYVLLYQRPETVIRLIFPSIYRKNSNLISTVIASLELNLNQKILSLAGTTSTSRNSSLEYVHLSFNNYHSSAIKNLYSKSHEPNQTVKFPSRRQDER